MTTPVLFLLGAVGLSIVLGVVVWLFSRPRKEKFGATVETFSSDLSALAPPRQSRDAQGRPHAGATNSPAASSRPKPGPRPRS